MKNRIVYSAARALFTLFNRLPRRAALFLGEVLGATASLAISRTKHKAVINLNRAFGENISHREKLRIAHHCFVNSGRSIADVMRFQRSYRDQIRPDIEVVGEEHFRRAYDRGKGVVAFTGHIGNFELIAAYSAQSGYKSAVIGRKLYDKQLDNLLVSNRESMGIKNIYTDSPPQTIMRYLRDGYALGILIDIDSFRVGGELTPFFGRPAKTPTGPTQLGLITGAAFVPIFCLAFPEGKYKIIMGPELEIKSRDRSRENVYRITCQMTEIIENIIRDYPDQWIWMHNRWHTRPEADDYEFLQSIGIRI